jgi:HEAT repeats
MATLENSMDTMPCRHCGSPVRPGMIRCRECSGLLAETGDEFVVAPQVSVIEGPKCPRCGCDLESGVDDCPSCASALLDDLLKGPEQASAPVTSTSTLRPRQPGTSSGSQNEWVPLREVPTPPPKSRSGEMEAIKAPNKARKQASIEDEPPGLFGDDDDVATPAPRRPAAPTKKPAAAVKSESGESAPESEVETSAACTALLASFATADATLRVEIAGALGKLGDKAAMAPLERHLTDQDIRVRRAVAEALVQLGHPKGKSLLEIAERKPAAAVLTAAKAPKPKRTGGGMNIDGAVLKKIGLVVVAVGVIAGGVWFFMNQKPGSAAGGSRSKKRKKKAAAVQMVPRNLAQSPVALWFA